MNSTHQTFYKKQYEVIIYLDTKMLRIKTFLTSNPMNLQELYIIINNCEFSLLIIINILIEKPIFCSFM